MAYRLLLLSTPVGPLGSGLGGGVELTLANLSQELQRRGHRLTVVAPQGSQLPGTEVVNIPGTLQPTAHTQTRQTPISLHPEGVLEAMWRYAQAVQSDYDLIVNFAYDGLPFYLTPFFSTPVAHFVSMGSLTAAMDAAIAAISQEFPHRIGVYTRAQADTLPLAEGYWILGSAVDLRRYQFCDRNDGPLCWLGRISPEKGLEDAVAAASQTGQLLKVMGKLENSQYWQQILTTYPQDSIEYLGFLETEAMQAVLRTCRALLMTPRWVEAFGNVAIEALACGVPVIAYRRGGPAEIVRPGKTGWLVEPDSVAELVKAIGDLASINRRACRHQAEAEYSLEALGARFEQWFTAILS